MDEEFLRERILRFQPQPSRRRRAALRYGLIFKSAFIEILSKLFLVARDDDKAKVMRSLREH